MIRRPTPEMLALHRRLTAKLRGRDERSVRWAHTAIEQTVAAWLDEDGLTSTAQHPLLPTVTVDFWLPDHGLVVECQGTYFHADPARYAGRRLTAEQRRKRSRDEALAQYVERAGLRLLVLWEEDLTARPEACRERLRVACGLLDEETLMATIERTMTTPEGLTIEVCRGDLTAEQTDAIVNAANGHLSHGGGVAAAIVRRGGHRIQAESDAWIEEFGTLATGEAALTSGGSLPAKAVIHAVGPIWHGGHQSEPQLLRSAVLNALAMAHEHGFESIALPAISSGIFGFPKDRCAEILLGAAVEWSEQQRDSSLRTIRFTNIDAETTAVFIAKFDERFGAAV